MTLKAIFKLPRRMFVAFTDITLPCWNWPVASLILSGGTEIHQNRAFTYEPEETKIVLDMMKGKKCFYDIGASIGYYSYLAYASGVRKIYAFEPLKELARVILRTAKKNNLWNLNVVNKFVGGGWMESDNNLAHAEAPAIYLDEFAEKHGIPDLIKIDTEGGEITILSRSMGFLKKYKPELILSLHSKITLSNNSIVIALLIEVGYQVINQVGDTYFLK